MLRIRARGKEDARGVERTALSCVMQCSEACDVLRFDRRFQLQQQLQRIHTVVPRRPIERVTAVPADAEIERILFGTIRNRFTYGCCVAGDGAFPQTRLCVLLRGGRPGGESAQYSYDEHDGPFDTHADAPGYSGRILY